MVAVEALPYLGPGLRAIKFIAWFGRADGLAFFFLFAGSTALTPILPMAMLPSTDLAGNL